MRTPAGTPVHQGDILAVLDMTDILREITESRSALAEAESRLHAVRTNYLKKVQLREIGQPQLEEENAARREFEAALQHRDRAYQRAQAINRSQYQWLARSPADGRVGAVLVQTNQMVQAGQTILTIVMDGDRL